MEIDEFIALKSNGVNTKAKILIKNMIAWNADGVKTRGYILNKYL
jgi:hypothetical protein